MQRGSKSDRCLLWLNICWLNGMNVAGALNWCVKFISLSDKSEGGHSFIPTMQQRSQEQAFVHEWGWWWCGEEGSRKYTAPLLKWAVRHWASCNNSTQHNSSCEDGDSEHQQTRKPVKKQVLVWDSVVTVVTTLWLRGRAVVLQPEGWIDALYECVCDWVNVKLYCKELRVVNKTRKALYKYKTIYHLLCCTMFRSSTDRWMLYFRGKLRQDVL